MLAEAHIDDLAELLLANLHVDFQLEHVVERVARLEAHVLRHVAVENQAAEAGLDALVVDVIAVAAGDVVFGHVLRRHLAVPLARDAHGDAALEVDLPAEVGHHGLVLVGEAATLALRARTDAAQIVAADNHILRRRDNRLAVLRLQNIVGAQHQEAGFRLRLHGERNVHGHLVAVKVRVERGTGERMELHGLALDEDRLERLNAQTVQRRRAVQQNRMLLDDALEDIPHAGFAAIHHALGALDVVHNAGVDQPLHDERLEQLQRHALGQAALVQLELRADDDNGTTGVVHALAQQVLAETTLLAAQEVRKGLERAVAGARHRATAAAVVNQRVHRFLKHALLVADDDIRRAQLEQALEAVVAVDDAAIQVVQVGGRKTAAVQLNHRAQIRRHDRDDFQNHPLRLVAAGTEGLDDLQTLDRLGALLAFGLALAFLLGQLGNFGAELLAELVEVELLKQLADGLRAHTHAQRRFAHRHVGGVARRGDLLTVFRLGQDGVRAQRGAAGVKHDVRGKVQHLFQRARADVQQRAHAARDALEIPDMAHRRGQLDVTHALAAHLGARHLNAALVADDALVAHALVLAAVAFPVLGRAKDALAVQAVALRLEGAVVNRFRLGDLAVGPRADLIRGGHGNLNGRQVCQFRQRGTLPSLLISGRRRARSAAGHCCVYVPEETITCHPGRPGRYPRSWARRQSQTHRRRCRSRLRPLPPRRRPRRPPCRRSGARRVRPRSPRSGCGRSLPLRPQAL